MDPKTKAHLDRCQIEAGCPLLAMGLWGDGVPVNWDRSESVDTVALNLPGQGGEFKALRLPICALNHKQISVNTYNDIFEVTAWSFQYLAAGVRPGARHDNSKWLESDVRRAKNRNKPLGVRGAMCEVRGDWKFYNEVFGFPAWNTGGGCCFKCSCTTEEACIYFHIAVFICMYIYIYIYIFIYLIIYLFLIYIYISLSIYIYLYACQCSES